MTGDAVHDQADGVTVLRHTLASERDRGPELDARESDGSRRASRFALPERKRRVRDLPRATKRHGTQAAAAKGVEVCGFLARRPSATGATMAWRAIAHWDELCCHARQRTRRAPHRHHVIQERLPDLRSALDF